MGYGVTVLIKKQVEIYRQGEIHLYQGRPAQLIGSGFVLVGMGAMLVGITGFAPIAVFAGILSSLVYMGLRRWADRLEQGQLTLPSQKGRH